MKESNSFTENTKKEVYLGQVEDKFLEELLCIIDACYQLQESLTYGFDDKTNMYRLQAYRLVGDYLRAEGYGEFIISVAQTLSHSVNDFNDMFNELALIRKDETTTHNHVFELMKEDKYKELVLSYRKEKVVPIISDVINTLKLERFNN